MSGPQTTVLAGLLAFVLLLATVELLKRRRGRTYTQQAPAVQPRPRKRRRKATERVWEAYVWAERLCYLALWGRPLSRREATLHRHWGEYRWREAFAFAKSAGVLDSQQRFLAPDWATARRMLRAEYERKMAAVTGARFVWPR